MKRRTSYALIIILIALLGVLGYLVFKPPKPLSTSKPIVHKPVAPVKSKPPQSLAHVVVIVEENKPYAAVVGSPNAPYFNSLIPAGALATNYSAITNPSLPNYIALTSGTTAGITTDCQPTESSCQANTASVADTIERSGRSWKMYAEDMTAACSAANNTLYAAKHNPFIYYPNIRNNSTRCANVVPFTEFKKDLTGSKLPNYAFISPNLCNDTHDCPVATGDRWLSEQVPAILASPAFKNSKSLLVITWDEGNRLNNHIPALFLGPAAQSGVQSAAAYSHYSLLHTIETQWNLPPLTENDKNAPTMNELLR